MTVRWTPTASRDLESLHAYISDDSPDRAADVVARIVTAADALRRHPEIGRRGRIPGTRELVVAPFVVAYRIKEGGIELVAIIHGARQWPDSF